MVSVGGIYTVIRSKAPAAVDELGSRYCLLGIYNDLQCKTEVEKMEPEDPAMKGAVQALRDSGVEVLMILCFALLLLVSKGVFHLEKFPVTVKVNRT